MPSPWLFNEHHDVGFSDADAVADYLRRSGVTPEGESARLQRWGIEPSDTVIEFGCGPGVLAVEAARIRQHVTAVDVSGAMLAHAESLATRAGVTNITFVQAGFLTFQPSRPPVDVVVSVRALHHLPDFWKAQALARVKGMLKPSGKLHLSDVVFSFAPQEADRAIASWIDSTADPDAGFPRTFFEDHVRREYSTYTWILEALIRDVGFAIDEAAYDPRQTYATYSCTSLA